MELLIPDLEKSEGAIGLGGEIKGSLWDTLGLRCLLENLTHASTTLLGVRIRCSKGVN